MQRQRRADPEIVKLLEIDALMKSYEDAYLDLTGVKSIVVYAKGWYWVHGHAIRKESLIEATNRILARIQLRDYPPTADEDSGFVSALSINHIS